MRKPFAVECRRIGPFGVLSPEWQTWRRYATQKQAADAIRQLDRNRHHGASPSHEFRLIPA
jgi:hypothetical protein